MTALEANYKKAVKENADREEYLIQIESALLQNFLLAQKVTGVNTHATSLGRECDTPFDFELYKFLTVGGWFD